MRNFYLGMSLQALIVSYLLFTNMNVQPSKFLLWGALYAILAAAFPSPTN